MEAVRRIARGILIGMILCTISSALIHPSLRITSTAVAQENDDTPEEPAAEARRPAQKPISINFVQLFHEGGVVGYVITALSLAMMALIFEHLLTIRRSTMIPPGFAEEAHRMITAGQFKAADELCKSRPSFLGYMLASAIPEVPLGYSSVEKAMEDAAAEQSARLMRKIEYLSVIGSVATMLGLLGTVWGMILAFMEFERKANPQISELAPGVYKALVTTLQGLIVAIPANVAFAHFRNRIDELVAQTSLMAEHIFADYKRSKGRARTGESSTVRRGDGETGRQGERETERKRDGETA